MFTLHLIFLLKNKFFHLKTIKCFSNIVYFLHSLILKHFIAFSFPIVLLSNSCFILLLACKVV